MVHVGIVACNYILYEMVQDYCKKHEKLLCAHFYDQREGAFVEAEEIDLWIHENTQNVFLSVAQEKNYEEKTQILLCFCKKPMRIENFYGMLDQCQSFLSDGTKEREIKIGEYYLNLRKRTFYNPLSEEHIFLTEKETDLLYYFYVHRKSPMSKAFILKNIWGYHADNDTHTLETHLYRLRQKMMIHGAENIILHTSRGYQLGCDFPFDETR